MYDPALGGLSDKRFFDKVVKYNNFEKNLHSTQKISEIEYEQVAFWRQVSIFKLYRINVDDTILDKAIRNVIAGILSNKDKSAILTLAAKVACYIKKPSNFKEYLLDITSPRRENPTETPEENTSSASTRTDATRRTDTTAPNEINLGDHKWFEKLVDSSDPFKKDVIERLKEAKTPNSVLWGPWFCLLLVRLETRSLDPFLHKVTALNSNLLKLYTTGEWEPFTIDSSGLSKFMEGFTGININDNLKFTLYDAIIDCYNTTGITNMEKGLLNFCTLQSLRYNGLN